METLFNSEPISRRCGSAWSTHWRRHTLNSGRWQKCWRCQLACKLCGLVRGTWPCTQQLAQRSVFVGMTASHEKLVQRLLDIVTRTVRPVMCTCAADDVRRLVASCCCNWYSHVFGDNEDSFGWLPYVLGPVSYAADVPLNLRVNQFHI